MFKCNFQVFLIAFVYLDFVSIYVIDNLLIVNNYF